MLTEFQSMCNGHLGHISVAKNHIELLDKIAHAVHPAPYRASPKTQEFEMVEIDKMLSQKIIESAQTNRADPIVFAPKRDKTFRFNVDFHRLNAVPKRDSYPITRMNKYIDSLGEAEVFSTSDANSGYCQVEIYETDRDKTALTPHHGHHRFIRMLFGFRNAPDTFQRTLAFLFSRWDGNTHLYISTTLWSSPDPHKDIGHVRKVLTLLRNAGVVLKLKEWRSSPRRSTTWVM